jgi:uncharacterized membrane protein YphA (DoxX/SURF4 family)
MTHASTVVIRISLVVLFLWFGVQQLIDAQAWVGFLPEWTGYIPVPGDMFVQLNGWMEVVFAVLLLMGVFTRVVAAVLGVHFMCIAATVGGAIGVRDAVLGCATIALALSPADRWTLDVHASVQPTKTS